MTDLRLDRKKLSRFDNKMLIKSLIIFFEKTFSSVNFGVSYLFKNFWHLFLRQSDGQWRVFCCWSCLWGSAGGTWLEVYQRRLRQVMLLDVLLELPLYDTGSETFDRILVNLASFHTNVPKQSPITVDLPAFGEHLNVIPAIYWLVTFQVG
jgi:hypothetical protein